jgi:competence protein ComGC
MNRIQFFVLTGVSSLVVLLLIGQIFLIHMTGYEQGQFNLAQQTVSQGQAAQTMMRQLAVRIFNDSEKMQDPALKDLLKRQDITYTPGAATNGTESPAPPAPTPTR